MGKLRKEVQKERKEVFRRIRGQGNLGNRADPISRSSGLMGCTGFRI